MVRRNEKSPVTVSYSNRAMYGGFSSGKTKTPGRKNSLLSVILADKTGLKMSDSVRIRQTFRLRNMRSFWWPETIIRRDGSESKMSTRALLTLAHFHFFVSFINYCLSINY